MVSSEAPLIFSKACEIFISELTLRAWMVAEENKRRTLQRSDVCSAVQKSDQYDFLVDIVPREELNYRGKLSKVCKLFHFWIFRMHYLASNLNFFDFA
jgi:hypothetical protein